jgi:SAM-dependent methyltransferase
MRFRARDPTPPLQSPLAPRARRYPTRWTPEEHKQYYTENVADNDRFFGRFGAEPEWRGKSVLDFGCGYGALSGRAAERGAARVLGVDTNSLPIRWAKEFVKGEGVIFTDTDVANVHDSFDLILTKDTLEHVDDVEHILRLLADRLAPEGEIWAGFSPLYHSPWGDHGELNLPRVPWLHTLPWPLVISLANRPDHPGLRSIKDIGLNGLTPQAFRRAVRAAGLQFASVRYNGGDQALLRPLKALRRVPPLEKYATVSIYAVLRHQPRRPRDDAEHGH